MCVIYRPYENVSFTGWHISLFLQLASIDNQPLASMFNLFKKKKYIQSWEYELLHRVVSALPNKYSYLTKQVAPESLIDVVDHATRKNGWKIAKYSTATYQQYLNESPKLNGLLVGIKVFDLTDQDYKEVELDLLDGVLVGCRYPVGKYDLTRIDVSGLRFKPHQSEDNIKYKAALKDFLPIRVTGFRDSDVRYIQTIRK
jgi:hypothetical protein